MAKKSKVEEEVEMNMTPMIDVTFQLLIFFIVTLKFRLLEKKLSSHLPTDFGTNASPEQIDEKFITVKLKQPSKTEDPRPIRERKTRFYIETEKITGSSLTDVFKQIESRLGTFRGLEKDAKGKIEAGPGVPHGLVVKVLDLYHRTKYNQITFVGLTQNFKLAKSDEWWNQMREKLAQ